MRSALGSRSSSSKNKSGKRKAASVFETDEHSESTSNNEQGRRSRRAAAVVADSRILESSRKQKRVKKGVEADGEFVFTRVRNLPLHEENEQVVESPSKRAERGGKTKKAFLFDEKKKDDTIDLSHSTTTTFSLPLTDTPMIRRNKELRQQQSNRRSSLGMRGKRASSLSNGLVAVPHQDIKSDEFHKHLDADLPDPHRMRQLLSWCAHRVLEQDKEDDKKKKQKRNASQQSPATAIARVIEEELLKDLADGRISTSWWSRPDDGDRPKKPNPQNVASLEKLDEFKKRLERLRAEKKAWTEIEGDIKPLIPPSTNIDMSLLLPKESSFLARLESLAAENEQSNPLQLENSAKQVEVQTDKLRHGMHTINSLATAAEKYADKVLRNVAETVDKTQRQAQKVAGTQDLEVRDVLRSLSKVDRM
ncbi:Mis12-Mtw1 protein family-domain-containing protein [Kockiozyma suomiensis]|uniref:Mis12-Mtw1 protein family-domain-containing protein n=1 Tax=Kockiozyma suomiensis TaxID=1337062 RepID=UPI003343D5E9